MYIFLRYVLKADGVGMLMIFSKYFMGIEYLDMRKAQRRMRMGKRDVISRILLKVALK